MKGDKRELMKWREGGDWGGKRLEGSPCCCVPAASSLELGSSLFRHLVRWCWIPVLSPACMMSMH